MLTCPIIGDVNFDHSIEVVSTNFLHYKLLFPPMIVKHFIEKFFETGYPAPLTFTHKFWHPLVIFLNLYHSIYIYWHPIERKTIPFSLLIYLFTYLFIHLVY